MRQLDQLFKIAKRKFGQLKEIRILMLLVSVMFDQYMMKIDKYMPLSEWRIACRYLRRVFDILEDPANENLRLTTISKEDLALSNVTRRKTNTKINTDEDGEEQTRSTAVTVTVAATLHSALLRLEENYTKALQQINNREVDDNRRGTQVSNHNPKL